MENIDIYALSAKVFDAITTDINESYYQKKGDI
ncbi:hypothetical protein Xszus_00114 [Xenorhabdus szentirmaii]|nr:hypothetical protein Xsze_03915 [Xenorhabdus szentirmaii DSM 16338]PHM40455.1 hypothetical protein Xszus_00114 [Xenorhabdus szentirmaii]